MVNKVVTDEQRQTVEIMSSAMETQTRDPIVLKACQYLIMKDAGYTVQQIAETWRCDRKTVYNWTAAWRRDGQMEEAEKLWAAPKIEEINAALSDFMNSVPAMIARVKHIILNDKSAKISVEAFAWAWTTIIKPSMDAQSKSGAPESAYASKKIDLSPTIISIPSFVRKAE